MTSAAADNTPHPLRVPPGPRPHLLLGNLPELGSDTLRFFENCARDYGDVVRLSFAAWPGFLLNHPDHFEYVLVMNHRNFINIPGSGGISGRCSGTDYSSARASSGCNSAS